MRYTQVYGHFFTCFKTPADTFHSAQYKYCGNSDWTVLFSTWWPGKNFCMSTVQVQHCLNMFNQGLVDCSSKTFDFHLATGKWWKHPAQLATTSADCTGQVQILVFSAGEWILTTEESYLKYNTVKNKPKIFSQFVGCQFILLRCLLPL